MREVWSTKTCLITGKVVRIYMYMRNKGSQTWALNSKLGTFSSISDQCRKKVPILLFFSCWNLQRLTLASIRNLKFSMGARKRLGIGLSYRPARLHRLHGGIYSLESISGLLKSLKIRAQNKLKQGHKIEPIVFVHLLTVFPILQSDNLQRKISIKLCRLLWKHLLI